MKRYILYELMRSARSKPQLMRKFKIFALVGLVGFVLTGAVAIWAGVKAINYVAQSASQVDVTQKLEQAKGELASAPALLATGCWEKAKSMLSVGLWLETPVAQNLASLKQACLDRKQSSPPCEGAECNMKEKLNAAPRGGQV